MHSCLFEATPIYEKACTRCAWSLPGYEVQWLRWDWVWTSVSWCNPAPIDWQWCSLYQIIPSATKMSCQQLNLSCLLLWGCWCVWRIVPQSFLRRCREKTLKLVFWHTSGKLGLTSIQSAWSRRLVPLQGTWSLRHRIGSSEFQLLSIGSLASSCQWQQLHLWVDWRSFQMWCWWFCSCVKLEKQVSLYRLLCM